MSQKLSKKTFLYFLIFNLLFNFYFVKAENIVEKNIEAENVNKAVVENFTEENATSEKVKLKEKDKKGDSKEKIIEEIDYSDYKIRINEVLADPADGDFEFIEIYNYGDEEIDLNNWILKDKTTSKLNLNLKLQSKEIKVFFKGTDFSFGLNNSDEIIYLISPDEKIFEEFSYEYSTKNKSWNYDENEWYEGIPTPGEKNIENPTTKDYSKIRINEIFQNPIGSDIEAKTEFIEFYNPTQETVDLSNWKLEKNSVKNKTILELCDLDNYLIEPEEYLTCSYDKGLFSLHNTTDTIVLTSPNPNIKFSISYKATIEGQSYNYADRNWYWAKITPNAKNKENPLTKNYPNLILSEILPNPAGDEATEEFIEIYNPNDFEVNLESWILKDSSASGSYIFNENQTISAKSYFIIYRTDFDFALNNSGGEEIYLISPNQKIQSQTEYQSAKENLSYNFDLENNIWRWSKFLTPNTKNIFNNIPEIEKFSVDKKVYQDIYANFEVKASDLDDDELKFTWDFGDGHKSYKTETSHKYLETGIYQASLKIYDGSEEVVKNFEIKVKKYPKYNLEIVKIVPNPKGLDSLNEYIVIKNKSGKKVNLQGWSIATGSAKDKIYNHPIRENLTIKNGKEEIVTRKYSAFSMPNKKGYIELRQPDGKVVSKVSYEKDKIKDDESYEKIGKEWQWVIVNNLDDPEVQEIITQALVNEKKWQTEIFEQKIADKVINKKIKDKNSSEIKNIFWLSNFSEKINLFLNKKLPVLNNFLTNVFKESYLAWLKNKVIAFNENRNFVLNKNFFEIEKLV